ncbi:MAG: tannase/feruloyl esterase family alpha/beta hydrolase [Herpetosiphon sp.]
MQQKLPRLHLPVRTVRIGSLFVAVWLVLSSLIAGTSTSYAQGCSATLVGTIRVAKAEKQITQRLTDLTTPCLALTGNTDPSDFAGLHAVGTINPTGVAGIQIDGYFPDTSTSNTNHGWNHDSQFVIRLPDNWNGGLIITGAPGVRKQYSHDFLVSDWVLARGYAFASTDKGNNGVNFFRDGKAPGDAVVEWHQRVTELTIAAKQVATSYYGKAPNRTYITGVSNGGYLVRYALENHPELYDGGVDWEGTLFRAQGPNLLTYLPAALKNYPAYKATGDRAAHDAIIAAGFEPGSEFLWDKHYTIYWDLTQRIYRESFDPLYDGDNDRVTAGKPFCVSGTPGCDADYQYYDRPRAVQDAVGRVSLTGNIGKPMITLQGTLDTLLPIRTDSDVYAKMIQGAGSDVLHRYYRVEGGNHVDGFYNLFPDRLRPILPCYRAAFLALETWIDSNRVVGPPPSGTIPMPKEGDVLNNCSLPPYIASTNGQ